MWHERYRILPPARTDTPEAAPAAAPHGQLFEDVTRRVGIKFVHEPGPVTHYQVPQITGSGCAFFDFDQDGNLDIFLVNQAGGAGYEGISEPIEDSAGRPTGRLYRQESDGRF